MVADLPVCANRPEVRHLGTVTQIPDLGTCTFRLESHKSVSQLEVVD